MESQTEEMHDRPAATSVAPCKRNQFNFTRENAREMQQRGIEARKRRQAELREREERYFALTAETPENYSKVRLSRTRAQIERLDEQMEKEREPKNLKFLADALAKLHELEAKLRGPSKATSGKPSSTGFAPLD